MGILSCCLSILVSVGLCSLAGLDYGPMHSLIPCLLVGLGVDDMFVIVQSYNNADREDKGESLSNTELNLIGLDCSLSKTVCIFAK